MALRAPAYEETISLNKKSAEQYHLKAPSGFDIDSNQKFIRRDFVSDAERPCAFCTVMWRAILFIIIPKCARGANLFLLLQISTLSLNGQSRQQGNLAGTIELYTIVERNGSDDRR